MKQKLTDPPKTWKEAERQKRPVPLLAIALCFALIGAFILFIGPALVMEPPY
jgi:hypothetical protein